MYPVVFFDALRVKIREEGPDVTFQNPLWRSALRQSDKALFDGVGRRAFGPESIRIRIRQCLCHGFQSELP